MSDECQRKKKQIDFFQHKNTVEEVCLYDGKCNQVCHFFFVHCLFILWKKNIYRDYFTLDTRAKLIQIYFAIFLSGKKSKTILEIHIFIALQSDLMLFFHIPFSFWGLKCWHCFRTISIRSLAGSRKILDKCNFTEGVEWIGKMFHKLATHVGNKLLRKSSFMFSCLHAVK